jgi:hypothetical protein
VSADERVSLEDFVGQVLSLEEWLSLQEPMYEYYRLGLYGRTRELPMWHELSEPPAATYEYAALLKAAETLVAKREGDAYERGWRDACDDFLEQKHNPSHPIGARKGWPKP